MRRCASCSPRTTSWLGRSGTSPVDPSRAGDCIGSVMRSPTRYEPPGTGGGIHHDHEVIAGCERPALEEDDPSLILAIDGGFLVGVRVAAVSPRKVQRDLSGLLLGHSGSRSSAVGLLLALGVVHVVLQPGLAGLRLGR